MSNRSDLTGPGSGSRRRFLKTSTTAVAGAALLVIRESGGAVGPPLLYPRMLPPFQTNVKSLFNNII